MVIKPGSKSEHQLSQVWAKKHVRSSVAQSCKENQQAVKDIDRSDEEYW